MGYSTLVDQDIASKMTGRWTPSWSKEAGSFTFEVTGKENGRSYQYSITLSGAEICAMLTGALKKATDVDTHHILAETFATFFKQVLRPQPAVEPKS